MLDDDEEEELLGAGRGAGAGGADRAQLPPSTLEQLAANCGRWDMGMVFAVPSGSAADAAHNTRDDFVRAMLGLDRHGAVQPHLEVFHTRRCFLDAAGKHLLPPEHSLADKRRLLETEWETHFGSSSAVLPTQFGAFVAKAVAQRLQLACGLTCAMWESFDGNAVLLAIVADEGDLSTEADRINYSLQTLNRPFLPPVGEEGGEEGELARARLLRAGGNPDLPDPLLFGGESDEHPGLRKALERWGHPVRHYFSPYAAYRAAAEFQPFYRRYGSEGTSPFRQVDRIRLVKSLVQRHMHVDVLPTEDGFFPLHDEAEVAELRRSFATKLWPPAVLYPPLQRLRDYFGERIALYFAFLSCYTWALVPVAVVGVVQSAFLASDGPELIVFGGFVAVWSTVFLQLWQRRNGVLNLTWGMTGFAEEEAPRPEFSGVQRLNPVTDLPLTDRRHAAELYARLAASTGAVLLMFATLLVAMAGVLAFKHTMVETAGVTYGAWIGGVASALQIQGLNWVFGKVAVQLTEAENHRTSSQFDNMLVFKTLALKMATQFSSLIYIAFLKAECLNDDCLYELRTQLAAIFITQLVIGNVVEVQLPLLKHRWALFREQGGGEEIVYPEQVERESKLEVYNDLDDYMEIVLQFATMSLFVVSLPYLPALALANNLVEVHVDAYKMCVGHRRPFPRGAEDIGSWLLFLRIISKAAAVSNCAIIVFTSRLLDGYSTQERFFVFIVAEHSLLLLQALVEWLLPAQSRDAELLGKRFAHSSNKLFRGLQMEDSSGAEEVCERLSLEIRAPTAHRRSVAKARSSSPSFSDLMYPL